jgi:hypothetical protein
LAVKMEQQRAVRWVAQKAVKRGPRWAERRAGWTAGCWALKSVVRKDHTMAVTSAASSVVRTAGLLVHSRVAWKAVSKVVQ